MTNQLFCGDNLDVLRDHIASESINQLIATAVAEKPSALETSEFFEERARRADYDRFDRIMSRSDGEAPREGD